MDWQTETVAAARRIAKYIRRTPVLTVADLIDGQQVELKLEHLQHTGSFKPRGAFNTLLSKAVPDTGVVAASGGNHGAAVAYAAHTLGIPAAVFVPEMAGPAKIGLIERAGANLTVVPGAYANALDAARDYERRTSAIQIHAYDAPETIAGQATLMREWEEQGLEADTVVIAVGGGGLVGGAMAWLGDRRRIVTVEPVTSCALHAALEAGRPVDVEVSGIAANALGAKRIGNYCFDMTQHIELTSVVVKDDDILVAQALLWRQLRQWVEPGGAAALAALTSGAYRPKPGERIAVLVCGANPTPDPFG